jgi:hypothetical protein
LQDGGKWYRLLEARFSILPQFACVPSAIPPHLAPRSTALYHDFHPIGFLPGISFFTSPRQYHPIVEAALERFNGQKWELFGDVMAWH